MTFDSSSLKTRVFGLIERKLLSPDVQFIDTLKFKTKAPNPETTMVLDALFQEVADTAQCFKVNLADTKGTFSVNNRDKVLYSPSIGELNGVATVSWGYKTYPLALVLQDEASYVTVRENNKSFELLVSVDNKQGVLKLWTRKGKTYTKSQVLAKLADKTGAGLATILDPVRLPTLPLLNLKKYIDSTLSVKSLSITEGGSFGATGAVSFYEFPDKYYRANAKAIGKLLEGYMGEDKTFYTWEPGIMLFKPLEVRQGNLGDYLHYTTLDLSGVGEDEDFTYSEDEDDDALYLADSSVNSAMQNLALVMMKAEDNEEFEYDTDEELPN